MEEQLLLFSRRHDFTTCPPSPSRLMPRRLALGLSSPTHSPTTSAPIASTPAERGYDPHRPPMFVSSSPATTCRRSTAPAAQKMAPREGTSAECEQTPAQEVVERLESHLHSVLPLPSTSSLSSLAPFSSLFVSPPSSPTISRLLSGSASSSPASPSSLSSFLAASLSPPLSSSLSSSSSSGSPPSSPSAFSPSKLARAMKKHVRPSKEEKEYFKHLFGQHHVGAKKRNKKSSSGGSGKKDKDRDAASAMKTMDDEEVEEWREQLEQFEVSKYFVGSAATSSSRARWQTALMLAYRDANKISAATESTKRSDAKHQKRRNSKRGEDLLPKKKHQRQHDVYTRDRGDELQAAARLVVEMNHLWDVAQQLMQGKIDVARLRRAKDSASWTLIDIPSPKTTTIGSPSSAAAGKCQSSGDKPTSFRLTLMSSLGYFTNSVLPAAPSPPSSPSPSPSLLAGAVDPKRRPSLAPAASSPPSLEETMFGCPSFPSTPGTARLRPRPRPDEAHAPTETRKVTIADEALKRRQPCQLSVAEGEVMALLLADLVVKQMAYELCLAGTLSRVMADAQ